VGDMGAEDGAGRRLPDRGVAAEVVDVGVADQDEVRLESVEGRKEHVRRRLLHARVDEQRALVLQEVLRERPRAEDGLDARDARRDLDGVPAHVATAVWLRRKRRTWSRRTCGFSNGSMCEQ